MSAEWEQEQDEEVVAIGCEECREKFNILRCTPGDADVSWTCPRCGAVKFEKGHNYPGRAAWTWAESFASVAFYLGCAAAVLGICWVVSPK